ncbi:ABC-three component system protein, partial [Povalibacter sp.]|uniref:ABC-three component system protein n=1 Tax=Povalibacter sp. TaxID=1962978 RepID=UPI002F42E69E
ADIPISFANIRRTKDSLNSFEYAISSRLPPPTRFQSAEATTILTAGGCDGYINSSGKLFQCYGALNGDEGKVDYLVKKMGDDFEKAKLKLSAIMKEWQLVHNLVDGLPIEAVETLKALAKANPQIKFGFFGLESFEKIISELPEDDASELVGPTATNGEDFHVAVLGHLVNEIIAQTSANTIPNSQPIGPVPVDKLKANALPEHWRQLIAGGWQNAHIVGSYFDQHPNPLMGETVAAMFNERYQYLRSQQLTPGFIMDSLYEFVTGIGAVPAVRQVAAQALLAYLFESCDIFENVTAGAEA